ncbi:MAG: hypothetical protein IKT08_05530 [Bacteroidales bacterium]|nr:hypothetical protein [Bacteroidales bacterium]
MKHILPTTVLIAGILLSACNTTKKLYEAQEYDQVIMRTAPRICAGQYRNDLIAMVAASYHKANQADHERIQALKASGQPDVWSEIFERYSSMKGRCEALDCFPKEIKKSINYTKLNLDDDLQAAQNKAEAYLTAKIAQILNTEEPDLDKADQLIMSLERVNAENPRIGDFKLKSLAKRHGGSIDKLMHAEVFEQDISPDRDETVSFKETKGEFTAIVTDHKLSKTATIKGKVFFIDPKSRHLLLKMPFEVSSRFEHSYSTVEGALEACSEQTMERLKQQPVPFPTGKSLLEDAEQKLLDLIHQKIQ